MGPWHSRRPRVLQPDIADAPTTVFTIDAGGQLKTVSATALGMDDPANP
jgi:hypothetical protein